MLGVTLAVLSDPFYRLLCDSPEEWKLPPKHIAVLHHLRHEQTHNPTLACAPEYFFARPFNQLERENRAGGDASVGVLGRWVGHIDGGTVPQEWGPAAHQGPGSWRPGRLPVCLDHEHK